MPSLQQCYSCSVSGPYTQVLPGMPVYICKDCMQKEAVCCYSWEDVDSKIAPPWNGDQQGSLSAYQNSATFIPFTCDKHHIMSVYKDGLRCNACSTIQLWTYDWTVDWRWKTLEPPPTSGRPVKKIPPDPSNDTAIALDLPIEEPSDD